MAYAPQPGYPPSQPGYPPSQPGGFAPQTGYPPPQPGYAPQGPPQQQWMIQPQAIAGCPPGLEYLTQVSPYHNLM